MYSWRGVFIETLVFEEDIKRLMSDEAYAEFQQYLAAQPAGDLIQEIGGTRKVRWNLPGTGKKGGARVIYYWRTAEDQLLMLLVYKKTRQDDLTPVSEACLRSILETWNG